MKEKIRILLVEDNRKDAELIETFFREAKIQCQIIRVANEEDYLHHLVKGPDVIISDYMLPSFDGLRALALLKQSMLQIPFILTSGKIGEETAVEVIKAGATNYVSKDHLARLPTIVLHELKEAEIRNQLSELQYQYEKLVKLSPDAIYILYKNRFVFANEAGCALLGVEDVRKILWNEYLHFFHPDCHDLLKEQIRLIEEEGKTLELVEEKMITLKGEVINVELVAAPFQFENKPAAQFFIRNITDRKNAEEDAEVQHTKLNEQIEKNKLLEYADLMKSEFVATLSHELRSPLNAVIGFSELLKDGFLGEVNAKQKQYSNDIYNAGQHLLALINDMLDLSKITAGKMFCEFEKIELEPFIQDSLIIIRDKAALYGIKVEVNIMSGIGSWVLDRRRFRQIIYNLLFNAVKFTPDNGMITLSVKVINNDELEIKISDTGPGIAQNELDKVFQPFVQTQAAEKSRERGTGLGLVVAKQLVELHYGNISIESKVGEGTTIIMIFPNIESTDEKDTSVIKPYIALLVEDDPKAASLIKEYLNDMKINVVWKTSAEAVLSEQFLKIPDLIIIDIFLPGMNGIELMNVLKSHPVLFQVPIVVTSIAVDENKSAMTRAVDVLQKPVSREQFIHSITRVIQHELLKSRYKILMADDDVKAFEILQQSLAGTGCELYYAPNGQEALAKIRFNPPDLLILDLLMPKMNGFEVLEELKKENSTKGIPVIVMTSKTLSNLEKALLRNNAVNVIQKVDGIKQQLQNEIKRWL